MAGAEKDQRQPIPIELLDEKIKDMTDLPEFVATLLRDGIPILLASDVKGENREERQKRWVTFLGLRISQVLANRKNAGLPNDLYLMRDALEREPAELIFREYSNDPWICVYVRDGFSLGMGLGGMIDPSEIRPIRKRLTVREYFLGGD